MLRNVYKKCMLFGKYFIPLNVLLVIIYSCEMIIPYVFSRFIDSLTQNYTFDALGESIIIIILTTCILLISSYFNNIFSSLTTAEVNNVFIDEIDSKLERLPLGETLKHDPSYLNNRIFNDVMTTVDFAVNNLVVAIIKLISTMILFYLIASISIWMLSIVSVTLIINILGIVVLNKLLHKRGYEYRDLNNIYHAANNDRLASIKETKVHAWYQISGKQLNLAFIDLLKKHIEFSKVLALLDNVGALTKNLTLILTMFIGGKLLISHRISIGQLILITTYINMCLANSEFFLKLGQSYQQAKISFSRLEEFLCEKDEQNGTLMLDNIELITLKALSFSYPDMPPLYTNLNLEFKKGSIYCLKGSNGDGKSTLLDILLGINYGYDGTVYYNNIDSLDLDMKSMRMSKVSVILQEPKLQRISIKENMIKGVGVYASQTMTDLCEYFKIENTIESTDAQSLSGGEKQKISVIRGLLKQSDVLILDEPVSAMDTFGINVLKKELIARKKDKIIIFISHNEELYDIVDEFIELSNDHVMNSIRTN